MKNKKGISLIVLIITIIVVIILAAVVILTLSKNNPIESAKEARFKEDVRTFQDELALTVSKQYTIAGGHRDEKITTSDFDEIREFIPSFSEKYRDKFLIDKDQLKYTKEIDDKEKVYAQSLNVKERLLPIEYQQVAYLESTGTQYIDTKFYAQKTVNHKYVINFRLDQILDHSQTVIGHDLNDLRVESNGYFMGNESYQYIGLARHTVSIEIVSNNSAGSTHTMTTIMDGSQRVERTSSHWPKYTTLVTIFTNSDPKNLNNRMIVGKVFEAKIYENNIMIRNYIPCYCTATVTDANGTQCSSGTIGMYDTVEGKFYTNQGTGEFIAGPDVNE